MRKLLFPISIIYAIITGIRNFFYDMGIISAVKFSIPVISVGNITTGGSGKTPMTMLLANEAKTRGYKPGIVSRGYGRKSTGLTIVHDGCKLKTTVEKAGDEPYLMANLLGNVPIVVDSNRVNGAELLINKYNVDMIILDDAFQHRKIFRHVNIVLLNSTEKKQSYHHLPVGNLRESLSNLNRADYIFVTKGSKKALPQSVADFAENTVEVNSTFQLKQYSEKGYENTTIPTSPVFAFCGIAHSEQFFQSVKANGITIQGKLSFRDHVEYTDKLESQLKSEMPHGIKKVITTEKDLVKLSDKFFEEFEVYVLAMKFELPTTTIDKIFNYIS